MLANLERCRFDGDIHLVSRSRAGDQRAACVASDRRPAAGVDAAVLVVPQRRVLDAIAACGRRGVGAAIVFASGYAEVGEAGRAEQEKLAAPRAPPVWRCSARTASACRNFGDRRGAHLRVQRRAPDRRARADDRHGGAERRDRRRIMRMAFLAKGLGVSIAVSTGNEADLTARISSASLIDDDDTQRVALFVEQIRQPQKFLALARRAREIGKPIVLLHPGRSQRARDSASSHTGALAGDYALMTALLRHAAVIVVDTLEELVDTAELLARSRRRSNGAGILTNSGAIKGFALDFADRLGLDIPRLGARHAAALQAPRCRPSRRSTIRWT